MKRVDENDDHADGKQHQVFDEEQIYAATVEEEQSQEEDGREQFHQKIVPVDLHPADAAFTAQGDVAQDGDVVPGTYGCVATRAVRWGRDDRFFTRNAVNADVEEAAEGGSEEEYENVDWQEQYH